MALRCSISACGVFLISISSAKVSISFDIAKEKSLFLLYSAHLFVPLTSSKLLSLGNTQINLVFRSLICTFASEKQKR